MISIPWITPQYRVVVHITHPTLPVNFIMPADGAHHSFERIVTPRFHADVDEMRTWNGIAEVFPSQFQE